jgi:4-hydroxy-4-methyl-2-oxoglutarate aldolase
MSSGAQVHSTITQEIERVASSHIEAARAIPCSTLHEAGGRIGALPHAIKPISPGWKLCGPAVTVHGPGGDNLWLHRAIYVAKPGDVLVVNVSGAVEYGYWGDIMTSAARQQCLGGLVIDGCVRDGAELAQAGFPVFARGLAMRGTGKDFGAIGWINRPVLIGDISVAPGDLVAGDGDGVVVLPREAAGTIIAAAIAREVKEADALRRIAAGERTVDIYGLN